MVLAHHHPKDAFIARLAIGGEPQTDLQQSIAAAAEAAGQGEERLGQALHIRDEGYCDW